MILDAPKLFDLIREDLRPYVETQLKGIVSIAGDQFEVLELLGEAPGRFRVILSWVGEKPAGKHKDTPVVEHEFRIIVSHNRGLAILRGESQVIGRAGQASLLTHANEVRDRLRRLLFPEGDTEGTMTYGGCDPIEIDDRQLDAYALTFRLKAAIPVPEYMRVSV